MQKRNVSFSPAAIVQASQILKQIMCGRCLPLLLLLSLCQPANDIFSVKTFWCYVISPSSRSSSIPKPRGSLGHHRWFCNQFSPFFLVLHCPLGPAALQACPFPDVVFPPLPLSVLSSSPFHCALQDGFSQTWWTGDMTIPLQFASLYDRQEVFV